MTTFTPFNNSLIVLARVILGVVLIAHGWDKFAITGLEGISGYFASIGIPAASVAAPLTGAFEIIAGLLIILGLGTRIVGGLTAILMLLAALTAHLPYGIFVANGGWELVAVIGAAALLLTAYGAGTWSVDAAIASRRTAGPATTTATETTTPAHV